jgi:hypothetical protein
MVAIYGTYSPLFFLWHWRRIVCTEFFSWFQCTQTVFKINTIIYRNRIIILENTWLKFDVFYIIDEIILLMLKLASNKIDTYLTSLRYLFSVFRGIFPAIFGRFSKKLSTPLSIPPYPCSNNYFSIIINNWGFMKKKYFGWSGVYFIFILHLYITVTCRHTIVFYSKDCCSNIKTSSKRLESYLTSLWCHERYLFSVFRGILPVIFGRFSKKLSTSAVVHQKNILPDY